METFSTKAQRVFRQAIEVYEREGGIDAHIPNPYPTRTIEHDLFRKNWIDNAQWCLEDLIRDPEIDPAEALLLKRRIDRSNQERTDLVELIDSYFLELYSGVIPTEGAKINTESPAWAIDRFSILQLKIYNMRRAVESAVDNQALREKSATKLAVLLDQEQDLMTAIDELLDDISTGKKYMKVYKQMKMYNDPELNPMLKGQTL